MKTITQAAILTILSLFLLSACTSSQKTTNNAFQTVTITSNPEGATVYSEGKMIGITPFQHKIYIGELQNISFLYGNSLIGSKLAASKTKIFLFEKDGYESKEVIVEPIAINNKLGFTKDVFKYPDIFQKLTLAKYDDDPTIMYGEKDNIVNRDNPGKTALEKTIIRWYFDSDPRGARIFWRVISSIPAIVKNTNEQYLTSTPLEMTKSFDIQGLSYENSRDVQIEIKVSKTGYYDQVKRFNVRQAIDQQEISSFFELVPKE